MRPRASGAQGLQLGPEGFFDRSPVLDDLAPKKDHCGEGENDAAPRCGS
ncbi:hypothetical protein [Kocuria sp. BT304]|nr:hypothetical protein [Kocuria sp. BT304]